MTVALRGYGRRYVGLASDPKPTLCNDSTRYIEPGSEFYALDTHTNYIFDGTGTWYACPLLVSTS